MVPETRRFTLLYLFNGMFFIEDNARESDLRAYQSVIRVKSAFQRIMEQLKSNKAYKFTFSEISFFQKWWSFVNETVKSEFRTLVEKGKFQNILISLRE